MKSFPKGKISIFANIFQMGWNHQLDKFSGAKILVSGSVM